MKTQDDIFTEEKDCGCDEDNVCPTCCGHEFDIDSECDSCDYYKECSEEQKNP